MICLWNKLLATQLGSVLSAISINSIHPGVLHAIITRNDNWFVDAEEIYRTFYKLKPNLIIFDPYAIGASPKDDRQSFHINGCLFAKQFDQNPNLKQIVWTSLDRDDLPELPNSVFIQQGISLTDVIYQASKVLYQ